MAYIRDKLKGKNLLRIKNSCKGVNGKWFWTVVKILNIIIQLFLDINPLDKNPEIAGLCETIQ